MDKTHYADDATLARIAELEAKNAGLRTALETETMRLVACDVVALSDTVESSAKARDMHPDYLSAACESVMRRVDECIQLRAENARLIQAVQDSAESWAKQHVQLLAAQLRIKELRDALVGMLAIEAEVSSLKTYNTTVKKANKALATLDATPELDALMRDAARLAEINFGNGCINKTWDDVLATIDAAMKEEKK